MPAVARDPLPATLVYSDRGPATTLTALKLAIRCCPPDFALSRLDWRYPPPVFPIVHTFAHALLDDAPDRADTLYVAETTAAGFSSSINQGGHQPPRGFFCVRRTLVAPVQWRAGWGALTGCRSLGSGLLTPLWPATPFSSGSGNSPQPRSTAPWQLTPWRAHVCTHPLHPSVPSRCTAPCAASSAPCWHGVWRLAGGLEHE